MPIWACSTSISSSKKFKLIDADKTSLNLSQQSTCTNWELCIISQEITAEPLTSSFNSKKPPFNSKKKDTGKGYHSLAENLVKFDELGKLPRTLHLDRLNKGEGIEAAMISNKAKWHKSCRLRSNNQMIQRAEKREHQSPEKKIMLCSSIADYYIHVNLVSNCVFFFVMKKVVMMVYMKLQHLKYRKAVLSARSKIVRIIRQAVSSHNLILISNL